MDRRRVVGIAGFGLIAAFLLVGGAYFMRQPTSSTPVITTPSPKPVKPAVKKKKWPAVVHQEKPIELPPRVTIHNYNIQQMAAEKEIPSSPAPAPAPVAPAVEISNYNIQQAPPTVAATPQAQSVAPPVATCPKVGYYVLSHEPTTDHRQLDDRGNWIPGHMELVRECRNGTLHEFPRWVGHPIPGTSSSEPQPPIWKGRKKPSPLTPPPSPPPQQSPRPVEEPVQAPFAPPPSRDVNTG